MSRFHVVGTGVHGREGPGFQIHRPKGSGDFVFLTFHAPIAVRFEYGEDVQYAGAGAAIVFTPGKLQWYWGVNAKRNPGFLDNSWVHFLGASARAALKRFEIPLEKIFYPRQPEVLLEKIATIRREMLERDRDWVLRASLEVEALLLLVGRLAVATGPGDRERAASLQRFRDLRAEVHGQFTQRWSVAAMARMAHLSSSRFSAAYKACFGTAPIDDLIDARLAHARDLLTNTTLPVKRVAALSGFENIYYFSRMFRKRIGCAPREYYARTVRSGNMGFIR